MERSDFDDTNLPAPVSLTRETTVYDEMRWSHHYPSGTGTHRVMPLGTDAEVLSLHVEASQDYAFVRVEHEGAYRYTILGLAHIQPRGAEQLDDSVSIALWCRINRNGSVVWRPRRTRPTDAGTAAVYHEPTQFFEMPAGFLQAVGLVPPAADKMGWFTITDTLTDAHDRAVFSDRLYFSNCCYRIRSARDRHNDRFTVARDGNATTRFLIHHGFSLSEVYFSFE